MSPIEIAAFYTAIGVFIMFLLKLGCGRTRIKSKISIGDGGDESLLMAMRAQANAVEDLPFLLLGLIALASLEANTIMLHTLGSVIILSRVLHGLGMHMHFVPGRFMGTILSVLALLTMPILLLWEIFGS